MKLTYSPLRYPGGKSAISEMVSTLITHNNLNSYSYAEPYAGGAGLALSLLFSDKVKSIYLNDIDRSIWSFWNAVLNDSERFINKIISTEITIEEWHKQRDIQHNKEQADCFDLAFSTFFLNRTNRSGIILKAGVIGGNEIRTMMAGYDDPIEFYVGKLTEGISTLAAAFWPKRVIVRLSDFKSNEYANLVGGDIYEPEEENPMLGDRKSVV